MSPIFGALYSKFVAKKQVKNLDLYMIFVAFGGVMIICYAKTLKGGDHNYPLWYLGITLGLIAGIAMGIRGPINFEMNRQMHYLYSVFYSALSGIFIILFVSPIPNSLNFSKYTWRDF